MPKNIPKKDEIGSPFACKVHFVSRNNYCPLFIAVLIKSGEPIQILTNMSFHCHHSSYNIFSIIFSYNFFCDPQTKFLILSVKVSQPNLL